MKGHLEAQVELKKMRFSVREAAANLPEQGRAREAGYAPPSGDLHHLCSDALCCFLRIPELHMRAAAGYQLPTVSGENAETLVSGPVYAQMGCTIV